ncbi:PQQ-binding-like beta-propeller repeat protein [Thalassotalea sp. LPB0316]|uniref:outer membrane protein assembly factor BamB family protein n=1 Tax=Thalassotalea sp. LPB0316 TaxID=2769490 RepID=UPI0018670031|nr:PQQ-binding-like beta-propeller repeat protein [Thalassotalea sp. LPB0316]QOL24566.1 PQQ-binding-like beta-propeller repeat protein [Thalassotalea sp. LPB0316]
MSQLYLGISGHVVCIEKQTGKELWKTKLKSSQLTNVCYEDGFVYAYSAGHLFCVNANNGDLEWTNKLPGLGYGYCIIATESQNDVVANATATAQSAATAAGGAGAAAGAGS